MLVFEQDIPTFLQPSPFLQALLSDGPFPECGIEIPDGCLKKDLAIFDQSDLVKLLQTLRFWLVPEQLEGCDSMLHYALDPSNASDFLVGAEEFVNEFPIVAALKEVVPAPIKLEAAVLTGRMDVVHYVHYVIEVLKHTITEGAGEAAAGKGDIGCLTYLHSHGLMLTRGICGAACLSGDLQCVQYVVQHCKATMHNTAVRDCVAGGDFTCLKYVIENVHDSGAFRAAAEKGNIVLLALMRAEWQDPVHGTYDVAMIAGGARNGQLEVLEFARQNNVALQNFQRAVSYAAVASDARCLGYLYELGCTADEETFEYATRQGHLPVMQILFEHNCPVCDETCSILARKNHLACLKYARERGCPWDEETCAAAAGGGSVECLQYLHENGCPWDESTCTEAAYAEEVRCLQYAHENGCPWTVLSSGAGWNGCKEDITKSAALAHTEDCLRYVLEQGVPLHPHAAPGSEEVLELMHEWGYPTREIRRFFRGCMEFVPVLP